MWATKAQISMVMHAVWSAPLLFAAWIVTRFYSSKLYCSIGTYTVSPTCQFAESVLSLYVHLFKSKIHPAGTVLHRSCFPVHRCGCRFFVIYRFDVNINVFCHFWDTEIWIVRGHWSQSLQGYIQKGYFVLDICKISVWKLFVSYLQLLLTIWKSTAVCLKIYGSFNGSSICRVRYVSVDIKKDWKVRKF